jgi:hypothetical protein
MEKDYPRCRHCSTGHCHRIRSYAIYSLQINMERCQYTGCRKKTLLITCRCKMGFCEKHRYAEDHACPFDYKKLYQEKLEKENVKVVADKLIR